MTVNQPTTPMHHQRVPARVLSRCVFSGVVVLSLAPANVLAQAVSPPPRHGIHSVEVPGGVASALQIAGSPAIPERARFIVELTRRFYNSPVEARDREGGELQALVAHMDFFSRAREATRRLDPGGNGLSLEGARDKRGYEAYARWAKALGLEAKGGRKRPRLEAPGKKEAFAIRETLRKAGLEMSAVARSLNTGERVAVDIPFETVPLPLSPEVWSTVIFERRVPAEGLAAAILSSRPASLTYAALLSLDEPTRAWLVERPELLRWMHRDHPGTFLIAAPALRVSAGVAIVPGGEPARRVWDALADESSRDPERFVRRVLTRDDGLLAYVLRAIALLTPAQQAAALAEGTPRLETRVERVRELYAAFGTAAADWTREERPYWRAPLDPLVILLALEPSTGHPTGVPGTERLWRDVFDADTLVPSVKDVRRATEDREAATLGYLCGKVFEADRDERRARADQVLFAARHAAALSAAPVADVMTTLRAVRRLPALVLSLERAGASDPVIVAAVARRAEQLSAIGDDTRALIAQSQWQGGLSALLAARHAGRLSPAQLGGHLRALAAAAPTGEGRFDGALLAWTREWTTVPESRAMDAGAPPVERAWLAWMSGADDEAELRVSWEGEAYRLDIAGTMRARLHRVRGAQPTPWVDLAWRMADAVARLRARDVTLSLAQREAADLLQLAGQLPRDRDPDPIGHEIQDQWKEAVNDLRRLSRPRDLERLTNATRALTRVGDALLARGLVELAYARVLAEHESASLPPDDAARRHDFGITAGGDARGRLPWTLPAQTTTAGTWRVQGALLGLDVALAEGTLRRVSARPPASSPRLNPNDRRTLVESVVLLDRASLTEATRDAIASALTRGRAAATAASGDPSRRPVLARRVGMDPVRESLWGWMMEHEPARAAAWMAPRELLLAGMDGDSVPAEWHAWGTSALTSTGCLCTRLVGAVSWEAYAGRVGGTMLAASVPDLQLRIAEQLAAMHLPAVLARDIFSAAVLDLVNEARAQDQDDWRALSDRVHAYDVDAFEQYLALFTTDGPLRPAAPVVAGAHP